METEESGQDLGRRRLLTGLAVGGAVVVGGVVGGVASAAVASGGSRRESREFDVACLGETWRETAARNPADDADFRFPFLVEGWIYPQGTIPPDGFVPVESGSVGRWFCRGWILVDGSRPEPHIASVQEYVFGSISQERLFPPDNLTSSGLEGTFLTDQVAARAVIGGTGIYMGAMGQVLQAPNGFNTSVLSDGTGDNAPNFRFTFDLLLPNI
jgi:hypothetical protein